LEPPSTAVPVCPLTWGNSLLQSGHSTAAGTILRSFLTQDPLFGLLQGREAGHLHPEPPKGAQAQLVSDGWQSF
jgi:hypothetical protein